MTTQTYMPAEVFPPGDFLRDELDERGWTITEFAEIIGRPVQAISEILNAKKEITTDTAQELAEALGTSPELWLNLQRDYWLFEARQKPAEDLRPVARRARLRDRLPVSKARSRGWLTDTDDLDELEASVCTLLELDSPDEQPTFALAARRANTTKGISPEQTAWLGYVRYTARKLLSDLPRFDRAALEVLAAEIPSRTEAGPSQLVNLIPELGACGVALVFAEGLPGGKLDGAVTFVEERPVIGLTTRGDRFDGVLYTLLHECAHLVLRHVTPSGDAEALADPERCSIVDDEVLGVQVDEVEFEANEQANKWLFPDGLAVRPASAAAIIETARAYRVHPSVIIGRVQYETKNWKTYRRHVAKVRDVLADAGVMS